MRKFSFILIMIITLVSLTSCNFFKRLFKEEPKVDDLIINLQEVKETEVKILYDNPYDLDLKYEFGLNADILKTGFLKKKSKDYLTFTNLIYGYNYQLKIYKDQEVIKEVNIKTKDLTAPVVLIPEGICLKYGVNYEEELLKRIFVYDEIEGIIDENNIKLELPKISLTKEDYLGKIIYQDRVGNNSAKTFKFKVSLNAKKDTYAPLLFKVKEELVTYLGNDYLMDLEKELYFIDNEDGLIPFSNATLTLPTIDKAQTYEIKVQVKDKALNTATFTLNLVVKDPSELRDYAAPIVFYKTEVISKLGSNYYLDLIKDLKIKDNVDGFIEPKAEMFEIPEIKGPGVYNVSFKIGDKRGNLKKGIIMLVVKQNGAKPEINTESDVIYLDNLADLKDLKSYFEIYDEEEGFIEVKDLMLSKKNDDIKVGYNEVKLSCYDRDLNYSEKVLKIYVSDYEYERYDNSVSFLDKANLSSIGEANALVIPVNIGNNQKSEKMRERIYEGFFGDETTTGWESVKSYYEKSSYNKFHFNGVVTPWYDAIRSQSYYAKYQDEDNYLDGSTLLLNEALSYFANFYDYSDFDKDNDGYIDAVYLIYNVPISGNMSSAEDNFYWAYVYWDFNHAKRTYQSTKGNAYCFASYYFLDKEMRYSYLKPKNNAQTYIHETGHIFGLDDYYDYDDSDRVNTGGYCGQDMMEFNIGDHGAYSKLLLNWANPVVISKSGTYDLPSFTDTGVCFIIPTGAKYEGIFSEYYLFEYVTYSGLNDREVGNFYGNDSKGYGGVKLTLVSSAIYKSGDYYFTTYNNSNTKYKLLRFLEADYNGSFKIDQAFDNHGNPTHATLNQLYRKEGISSFGRGNYLNFKSPNGYYLNFSFEVLENNLENAKLRINFK